MTVEEQIAELRARVEALEGRVQPLPRLGPRPETPEQQTERTQRMVDAVTKAIHEHETDADGRQICTTSGAAPSEVRAKQREEGNTGQHGSYIVLCEEERKKGFVRPYRYAYKHVGRLEQIISDGRERADQTHEFSHRVGGCGAVTTMGRSLSETYARDPKFYGATFCVQCNAHFPVNQFTWSADGQEVGS